MCANTMDVKGSPVQPAHTEKTLGAFSPLRFRKILAARGEGDCLIAFRRLIALLGKTANVGDLAVSLAEWNSDGAGDRRRTRWAFDYYDAGAAAPDASQDAA